MSPTLFTLAAVAALATAGAPPAGYVRTPNGFVLEHCVHEVPSGAVVEVLDTHTAVSVDGAVVDTIPHCAANSTHPMLVVNGVGASPLPADYDGWEEYTAYNHSSSMDVFNGYFSVPDIPAAVPDQLFIFTGLQNINWIPKVDPFPSEPFDIIQPVLQYPGDSGDYWSVKSWYVSLNAGAYYSTEMRLSPGDDVYGIMERQAADQYVVSSVVGSQATTINPKNSRLSSQPWAYVTLECYGCQDCATYPTKPTFFTKMDIQAANNVTIKPTWLANPKPAQDRKCHESVSIMDPATVTIYFDGQN